MLSSLHSFTVGDLRFVHRFRLSDASFAFISTIALSASARRKAAHSLNPPVHEIGSSFLLRKEVIQPHLPIRLPCYDFTPIIEPTFDCCPLAVSSQASGVSNSHGVTGGVYKTRERIHRDILIRDY